jgi:hypothetical protein
MTQAVEEGWWLIRGCEEDAAIACKLAAYETKECHSVAQGGDRKGELEGSHGQGREDALDGIFSVSELLASTRPQLALAR